MEIHFQQQQQQPVPRQAKFKARSKGSHQGSGSKFVGVRQRPSGRWVAEIKDTTQKIRMWLGTFETAEEAARAYDEAARLLRGSNTRTNFVPRAVSSNSPLASRIRSLLNHKKLARNGASHPPRSPPPPPPSTFVPPAAPSMPSSSSSTATTATTTTTTVSVSTISICSNGTSASSTTASPLETAISHGETQQVIETATDNVYRPYFHGGGSEFDLGNSTSDLSWIFESAEIDRLPPFTQEVLELPRLGVTPEEGGNGGDEGLSEFERMKVERQISASLYAINGVHEYLEAIHDPSEALWDLPPLCHLFCHS